MTDNRTGEVAAADTEVKEKVPLQRRGPTFLTGETITLRGGDFRVEGAYGPRLVLQYLGPSKLGQNRAQRRRAKGKRPRR